MSHVLIIDDNTAVATALDVLFSLHDIDTQHAESPQAGLARLEEQGFDLVIQDMNFSADTTSGEEGQALFAQIRRRHPDLPVILLTAWTHLGSAVELVKAGAADYIAKPWDDRKLLTTVNNLLELSETRRELDRRRERERRGREALAARY
ncbi:response regulator, partial [Xanthomonas sp. Kuri4-3]